MKRTYIDTMSESSVKTSNEKAPTDDTLSNTIKKMCLSSLFDSLANSEVNEKLLLDTSKAVSNPEYPKINLVIRLLKGSRIQHCFNENDTIGTVLEFISSSMKIKIDLKTYVLYANEVPKRELKLASATLHSLGIKDRTVLALDKRD